MLLNLMQNFDSFDGNKYTVPFNLLHEPELREFTITSLGKTKKQGSF